MNTLRELIKGLDAETAVGFGKILIGFFLSGIATIILFLSAWYLGGNRAINFSVVVFGGVAGWILGILLSPKSKGEATQFSEYGKAISMFISGFLVAKIDILFNQAIQHGDAFSSLFAGRLFLFGAAFGLGTLATFIGRRYVALPRSSSAVSPTDAPSSRE
ncbi:MAG: hypothetical protein ACREX9_22405 [Gammaproteobacteria bacterium]